MGCCLVFLVLAGAPRVATVFWWLFQPVRFQLIFPNWIVPVLGVIFLPWTTLAYIWVTPNGLSPLNWCLLVFAFLIDISTYGGGGSAKRRRKD